MPTLPCDGSRIPPRVRSRAELRSFFETGLRPTECDFADLFESCQHRQEGGQWIGIHQVYDLESQLGGTSNYSRLIRIPPNATHILGFTLTCYALAPAVSNFRLLRSGIIDHSISISPLGSEVYIEEYFNPSVNLTTLPNDRKTITLFAETTLLAEYYFEFLFHIDHTQYIVMP
jgi:hypothetical protein